MSKEILVINDANIFFDLISVGLLEDFCKIPIQKYTTDFVINEIKHPDQISAVNDCVSNKEITEITFSSEEVMMIKELQQREHAQVLSIPDCSVWFLAKKLNGILLTGDSKLSKIASEDSIEVHGILYVFQLLVDNNIVSAIRMAEKLESLLANNKRLPEIDCKTLIEKWRGNGL